MNFELFCLQIVSPGGGVQVQTFDSAEERRSFADWLSDAGMLQPGTRLHYFGRRVGADRLNGADNV